MPNTEPEEERLLIYLSDVAGDVYLTVSPDDLTVRMTVISGSGERQLNIKMIQRLLSARKISQNINHSLIQKTLNSLTKPFTTITGVVIVEGVPAVDGADTQFIAKFSPANPKIAKGDELLTMVEPTQGTNGRDVFDKNILAKPGQPIELKILENVVSLRSEEKDAKSEKRIVADCDGWAILANDAVAVSPIYAITISDDKYRAKVSFNSSKATAKELTFLMNNFGIKYGVQKDKIKKLTTAGMANNAIVAQGIVAEDGEDAVLEYYFARKPDWRTPDHGQKESVKNKNVLAMYDTDEKLLLFRPAVPGVDGKTIFGESILVRKVDTSKIMAGNNVKEEQIESGVIFYGKMRGAPVLHNNKLSVFDEFVVDGDLNPSIGNIDFDGNVHIKGSVPNGYSIKTDKNITVDGVVYNASLSAEGDITIKAGMTGIGPEQVFCAGTLKAKYLYNTYVDVDGDVTIVNEIIASHVCSRGKVECKNGVLHGGDITALKGLQVNILGNSSYVKTLITVGKDFRYQRSLKDYDSKKEALNEEELQLNEELIDVREHPEILALRSPREKEQLKVKLVRLTQISKERDRLKTILKSGKEEEKEESIGEVSVTKELYPGVIIKIEEKYLDIEKELKGPLKGLVVETKVTNDPGGMERKERKLKLV